jgi:uncharacterized protein (DUF849 family)
MPEPVIIECAINGETKKDRNPHVPRTSAEIAAEALSCLAAGASIIHTHIHDVRMVGQPAVDSYIESWLPIVVERPDAILYSTIAIAPTPAEKFGHYVGLAQSGLMRMAAWDTGSVNIGSMDADGMPCEPSFVYSNGYDDIAVCADIMSEHGLGPSISIFEPGFLRTVLSYYEARRLPGGSFIKFYFGGDYNLITNQRSLVTFGMPPKLWALETYLKMLEGYDLPWGVAVLGGDVIETGLAQAAMERGGHVRVGLEDYGGPHTPQNVEMIAAVSAIANRLGRRVATTAETTAILDLPRKQSQLPAGVALND